MPCEAVAVKFRSKILLAFLLAGLPLVAVNVWWIVRHQRVERERTLERLRGEAEAAAAAVQVFLRDLAARGEQTARTAAQGRDLQAYLEARLTDLRRWTAGIAGLAWADADGRIVAGRPADLFSPGASVANGEAFQGLRGGQAWVLDELVIEEAQGRSLPVLRMLVRNVNGTFRGAVVIGLRPEVFQPVLARRSRWSEIRLADRSGRLAYASDLAEPSSADRQRWSDMPGVRQALQGGPAMDPEVLLPGIRQGMEWMTAHVPVPQIGWVASALVPAAEAMRASRETLYKEVAAQGLLVVLCVAAALILAHRVAAPTRRLADGAHRLAAGDRAARVGLTGRDEVAAVGRAFDEMADALDASWRGLAAQRDAAEGMAGRLATVGQLANLVNSTLDPHRVFDFIAEATSRLLDGTAALLLVADETDESLTIRASHGVGRPERRTQDRFRAGEGLAGWVFQRREPLVLPDMLADPRTVNRAWIEAEGLHAFAGVPLMLRDRCLGVLCAMRAGELTFGAPDVDLLASFAAHAATAIQNARLYERAEGEGERLRAILEAIPEAVMVVEGRPGEREIRFVMANRARVELMRTPALVLGARTPDYELIRPDGTPLEDAELPLQRAMWGGEPTRGQELAVRFPDGSQRYILGNAVPLPEVAGTRRAVAVLQDITERKQAEEALRASEERFRRVADSNMIGIAFWDVDGSLKEANQAFLDLIGSPREDLLSGRLRWRDMTPPEYAHLDDRAIEEMRETGVCTPFEKEYLRNDGGRVPILLGAALLEKSGHEGVAFALDLTERNKAEEALERLAADNAALYKRAAREAQVKGLLLDELHHRVRNTLALIASFLEIELAGAEGRDAKPLLEDAIARVEGLALVHNTLAGVGFEAAEYGPLARGLAEQTLIQGRLASRVTFQMEGPPLQLPSAQLTALGLITNELFTNITKHAFPGDRTGNVEVTVEAAAGEAAVRVRDDGVGLPAGFAEQPGHLGLQLIRSLAEVSLKGTFALESSRGTTAVIRFPLPAAPAPGRSTMQARGQ